MTIKYITNALKFCLKKNFKIYHNTIYMDIYLVKLKDSTVKIYPQMSNIDIIFTCINFFIQLTLRKKKKKK
ncbi:hypothetical protein [Plasmodium yoelii yoelii]|uniref:Uncharacterized protein n=1 Tax=Plasmodium yoelii yoelii TaxID=73239 RepID=Q7RR08_PLAYO|nr:hypothetical protein [Plasmodium yoelii yoelii]